MDTAKINMLAVVSPRKSGTHLLTTWIGKKYPFRGKLKIGSTEGGHYSLGHTFHTSFRNYFSTLDRDDFTGGTLLPLKSCIGLIGCRHPADVFLSHLEFSFKNNNTAYSLMNFSGLEEKIEFVITNNFYEEFFECLFEYTAWSGFENFFTVAYEDLCEAFCSKDGVEDNSAIEADKFLNIGFDEGVYGHSATFNSGTTGRGLSFMAENCPTLLKNKFYLKYCDAYGYDPEKVERPTKIKSYNLVPITTHDPRPKDQPILVEGSFSGHNILYFNGAIYAIPVTEDFFNMLSKNIEIIKGDSLEEVRGMVGAAVVRSLQVDIETGNHK